jgi:glyoxylase-like metal-dependent hydrolase (beta-lactamase superfamily II)
MGCGDIAERHVADLYNPIILREDKKIHFEIQEITKNKLFGFDTLDIPGHAPDHVAFYHKECKWLFAGDLLIENLPSNAFIEPDVDGNRTKSLLQQRHSLEKCLALDVELVFSGHGNMIGIPANLIKERIKEIDVKAGKYINMIKSGS